MTKLKRLWMVVLLVVVLMATMAGVAAARPNTTPHHGPLVVTKLNKPFLFIDVAMTRRYNRILGATKK